MVVKPRPLMTLNPNQKFLSHVVWNTLPGSKGVMTFPREYMNYRERHCPPENEKLHCLILAPKGYVTPFPWPKSCVYVPYAVLHIRVDSWEGYSELGSGRRQCFLVPLRNTVSSIDQLGSVIPIKNRVVRAALDTSCRMLASSTLFLNSYFICLL